MSAVSAQSDIVSTRAVLRAALVILRRRPILYIALAILLVLLPDLLSEAVANEVTSALPVAGEVSAEKIIPDLLLGLGAALAVATLLLGPLALEAIVVFTALAPRDRASLSSSAILKAVLRTLPLFVAVSAVEIALVIWAPEHGWLPGMALSLLWFVTLPVLAAENTRLSSLPGRLRALARGNGSVIVRLLVADLFLSTFVVEMQFDLPDSVDDGSLKAWTLRSIASVLIAALALFADATVVALYLALRRFEDVSSPSGLVRAFD